MALGPNWMPCWVLDDDTKPSSCAPDTNTGFSNWVLEEGEILSPRALGSGIESGQAWKVMEGLDCCCLVIKSYLTLCNPRDYSPPGSSVHWLFQARILEWVAFSFSRGSSQPRDQTGSPALQADALPSEPPGKTFCCWSFHIIKHTIDRDLASRFSIALSSQLIILRLRRLWNCVKQCHHQGILRTVTWSNETWGYVI